MTSFLYREPQAKCRQGPEIHKTTNRNQAGPEHDAQGGSLAGGAAAADPAQLARDVAQLRPQTHLLADVVQYPRLQ